MCTIHYDVSTKIIRTHGLVVHSAHSKGWGAQWCGNIYCAGGLVNFNTIGMSRIGKKPIPVPVSVRVSLAGRTVTVVGPKGALTRTLPPEVDLVIGEGIATIVPAGSSRKTAAFWGLGRSLVANMVRGVTEGFEKKLEFEGVGFRAAMDGNALVLSLGFSHPVRFSPREGIVLKTEKQTITVSGADKEAVGMAAAAIRDLKRPEPYKGKGIRYQGEVIRRKAGKKAVAAA